MLSVISAPRYADLEEHLVARLMTADGDPLRVDTIIVPNAAVRRRLTLAVADRHGICARVDFAFLAQWLWRQIALLLPDIPHESPFDPQRLRWGIERVLADAAFVDGHAPLARYLDGADPMLRFGLASRLADLFDQYLTYRPEWLAAWATGDAARTGTRRADEVWQAALWRALLARMRAGAGGDRSAGTRLHEHPARDFLTRLGRLAPAEIARLFPGGRVRIFALPTLPPLYLELLDGLARRIDVDLYVQNPCRQYWQDLVSQREHARRVVDGSADYHEVGHRLLSAWGRQTQAYLHQLAAIDDADECEAPEAGPAGQGPGLLARIQWGIRELVDLEPGSFAGLPLPDRSLEIHACHSLTRELEVLQDALLARLAEPGTDLQPADILVVVPDLEAAATLIDGVFGNPPARCAIPYAITGLAAVAGNGLAQSLLAVLDFSQGRMPMSELVTLLHRPEVAAGLALDAESLARLLGLLQSADVHWGLDDTQRAALDLPGCAPHTLSNGRARLLLGHALPDGHAAPFLDLVPAGSAEGADSLLLGTLDSLLTRLAALRERLRGPLTAAEWQRALHEVLQLFLAVDPPTPAFAGLRVQAGEWRRVLQEQIARHVADLSAAGPGARHPVEILRQALGDALEVPAQGGVPTGALTFAAMSSLRGLPFRMVCVLGLDDGVFPAVAHPFDFDLLARDPRPGDRQRGEDERNLFLDLLLAAQETLYLSYSGRNARDNSLRPPSTVLAELIDSIAAACALSDADLRSRLVIQHPLQPFDERYFLRGAADGLYSFRGNLAAALRERAAVAAAQGGAADRAVMPEREDPAGLDPAGGAGQLSGSGDDTDGEDGDEGEDAGHGEDADDDGVLDEAASVLADSPAFLSAALPPLDAEWRQVELEQLIGFLQHPARALLRRRLGVRLPDRELSWDDAEDLLPTARGGQALASRILPALLAGTPSEDCFAWVAAGPEFPAGGLGEAARRQEFNLLVRFAAELRRHTAEPWPWIDAGHLACRLDGEPWTLAGPLGPFHRSAAGTPLQLMHAFSRVGVKDELRAWVTHLWALAHLPDDSGFASLWLGRDRALSLQTLPVGMARAHLETLLGLYRAGLREPLRFFPRSARALLEHGRLSDARRAWLVSRRHPHGESGDPAWQLVLRGVRDPLDAEFERCARTVLEPLLAACGG